MNKFAERSVAVSHQLHTFGVDSRPYVRAPIADELFAATITSGDVQVWPGVADLQIVGERKRRQAVLNVTEGARDITRTFPVRRFPINRPQDVVASAIMGSFPINVPNGKLGDYRIIKMAGHGNHVATVEATMTAPKTSVSLLVGFDEIRQFIAMLPRRAITIEQAHAALRPSGLSAQAIRQGEWFLDEATPAEQESIAHALKGRRMPIRAALEPGSSHSAIVLSVDGVRFATGLVQDSRTKHHRPLHLDGWYRIVRNREVVIASANRLRTRTWD